MNLLKLTGPISIELSARTKKSYRTSGLPYVCTNDSLSKLFQQQLFNLLKVVPTTSICVSATFTSTSLTYFTNPICAGSFQKVDDSLFNSV